MRVDEAADTHTRLYIYFTVGRITQVDFEYTLRDRIHLSFSSRSFSGISEIGCPLLAHVSDGVEIFRLSPKKLLYFSFSESTFQGVIIVHLSPCAPVMYPDQC